MNANQYAHLSSEVNLLTELLGNLPSENFIERIGLEYRLSEAIKTLESINPYHVNKKAKLTFRGTPVQGSESISAKFAAKATGLFADVVAAVTASFTGVLHGMGPIPDSNNNQLMITGTAIGSFGFEFELPKPDEADLCPSPPNTEKAVDDVRKLFETAALGNDNELSDLVEEIQPRAIKKVFEFLHFLEEQNSLCGLEFNDHFFRFANQAQLAFAAARLNSDNIHTENVIFSGRFKGLLPASRTFEFETSIDKETIKGKVSTDVSNPELINRDWWDKPVIVEFMVTRIGESRPKYTLLSIDDIKMN